MNDMSNLSNAVVSQSLAGRRIENMAAVSKQPVRYVRYWFERYRARRTVSFRLEADQRCFSRSRSSGVVRPGDGWSYTTHLLRAPKRTGAPSLLCKS